MTQWSTHPSSTVLQLQHSDLVTPWSRDCWSEPRFQSLHQSSHLCFSLVEESHLERVTKTSIPLSSTFFNPELMYVPGELDKFLVGLATQPRQKFDNVMSEQLTNHLFQGMFINKLTSFQVRTMRAFKPT